MDNSVNGVVLFSFGSLTNTSMMSNEMKRSFLNAFARFPQHDFIWKIDVNANDTLMFENVPNVHTFKWVEQKALLQHPKLQAFMTHCGMNSVNEAANAGVPFVAIPLFGDQLYNAAIVK